MSHAAPSTSPADGGDDREPAPPADRGSDPDPDSASDPADEGADADPSAPDAEPPDDPSDTPPGGGGDDPFDPTGGRGLADRLPWSAATAGVVVVTLLSLLLRLVGLGERIFHWDEGRVGYWILRFDETGEFFYRPIIHGPFLPVVNNALFDVVAASDFAARLPVAIVGGLLPLAALCFVDRLRGRERVALALVLAVDPLLVYYGRFMRGDVLVGSFCFAAFALTVYALDRRRTLPLFGAVALLALGFTAKENALVYLACFVGGAVLVVDHGLVRTASRTGSLLDAAVGRAVGVVHVADAWTAGGRTRDHLAHERGWDPGAALAGHLAVWVPLGAVGLAATFVGVTTFFYAPRPDLWNVFAGTADPLAVFEEATVGAAERFYGTWAAGSHSDHPYLPFLGDLLETLAYGSGVTVVLGVIGFLVDGYGDRGNRALVAFATYWAAASVIGYPVATDIQAPWAAVHVVLPLSVPAAVGVAYVVDSFGVAITSRDAVSAGLAALVVFAGVGGVAVANADYWNSASEEDKQVLQWAQPENDLEAALHTAGAISRSNEGTDVLFVGTESNGNTRFYVADEASVRRMPPGGPAWHSRLPLPWYFELYGAEVNSTPPEARFDGLPEEMPPVVVAKPWDRPELEARLDGYRVSEYDYRLWGEQVVIFVDRSALEAVRTSEVDAAPASEDDAAPRDPAVADLSARTYPRSWASSVA